MFGPKTLEEAKRYRYNKWGGNPRGNHYDSSRCADEAYDSVSRMFYQCSRKPGHGPDGIFCKQHARMREKE